MLAVLVRAGRSVTVETVTLCRSHVTPRHVPRRTGRACPHGSLHTHMHTHDAYSRVRSSPNVNHRRVRPLPARQAVWSVQTAAHHSVRRDEAAAEVSEAGQHAACAPRSRQARGRCVPGAGKWATGRWRCWVQGFFLKL